MTHLVHRIVSSAAAKKIFGITLAAALGLSLVAPFAATRALADEGGASFSNESNGVLTDSTSGEQGTSAKRDVQLRYSEMVPRADGSGYDLHPIESANETLKDISVGTVIDAKKHVKLIDGFTFFDSHATNGVLTVSENSSENVIDYFYVRLNNCTYTVNLYAVSEKAVEPDGGDLSTFAMDPSTAVTADQAAQLNYELIGTEEVHDNPFGQKVVADELDHEVEGMLRLGSYPEDIEVGTDPEANVINLFYTEGGPMVSPEDKLIEEVPEKDPSLDAVGGEGSDSSAGSNGAGTAGGNDGGPTADGSNDGAASGAADNEAGDTAGSTAEDEVIEDDEVPTAVFGERDTLVATGELAQTGDQTPAFMIGLVAGSLAVLVAAFIVRRRFQGR